MKKKAFIVVSLMMLAKMFGFIKNIFLARYFGTSNTSDSYQMAISIATILFGAVLFSHQAFTPGYYNTICEEKNTKHYVNTFINFISIVALLMTVIYLIIGKYLIHIFAPGFGEDQINLTNDLLSPIIIGTAFLGLANIFSEYLRCKESFIMPQILYLVINIVEIITLPLAAYLNIKWLSYGYLLANFIYFILLIITSFVKQYRYSFTFEKNSFKSFGVLLIPVLISSMLSDINSMVDKIFASSCETGVISGLNYAINIRSITLIAASGYITVMYPKLSKLWSEKKIHEFESTIKKSLLLSICVYIPGSILLFFISKFVTKIVYFRGSFDDTSLTITSFCLSMYTIGIVAIVIRDIFIKALYCMNGGKQVIIVSLLNVLLNVLLSFILVKTIGYQGLPLATSISTFLILPLLFFLYKKRKNNLCLIEVVE